MATEPAPRPAAVKPQRLWFGLTASAIAWFGLGLADMFITWRTCLNEEQFGGPSAHPLSRVLYFAATGILFAIAISAGVISYGNWRKLSSHVRLFDAEGRGRQEFMALLGIFVSFTLGVGIFWLGLPLLILRLCERAR